MLAVAFLHKMINNLLLEAILIISSLKGRIKALFTLSPLFSAVHKGKVTYGQNFYQEGEFSINE